MRRTYALLVAVGLVAVTALVLLQALRHGSVSELSPAAYSITRSRFVGLIGGQSDDLPEGFRAYRIDQPFVGTRLAEPRGHCRGGGTYLLRRARAPRPLLIGAPHRGADRLTGSLTLRLFVNGGAAAAAWNSVPRRAAGECGRGASDLAQLTSHPFTAFSEAFAEAYPEGRIVQLHGFDPQRRSSPEGRAAAIILSNATSAPTSSVKQLAACLRQLMPGEKIAVYPTNVRELGALGNAQAKRLRAIRFPGFVHIELSLAIRERLIGDEALLEGFSLCLEGGL